MNKIRKNWYITSIILIGILAFALRIKTYFLGRILWHDECSLAMNILTRNISGFFKPLDYDQKAPALFMILSKIFSYIGGIKELSLRFITFISGLFSVICFYFLSKEVLKNKSSIIIANFLFAINYQLISFAQRFKQYSFDVFLFIASILFFSKLDLNKESYKKCFLYSFFGILLILASFPCIFVVSAYILYCILTRVNFNKLLSFVTPLGLICFLYYLFDLKSGQKVWMNIYFKYWESGFINLNLYNPLTMIRENLNFFFAPNNFALIGLILLIIGFVLLTKDKNKTNSLILLTFPVIMAFSILQIYPIWQRAALYLVPILILLLVKSLDLVSRNMKIISFLTIFMFLTYFSKYSLTYLEKFFRKDAFLKTDGLTYFPKLVKLYTNDDILVINSTTEADIRYYSAIYHFKPKRFILEPILKYDKDYYYTFMSFLPHGYNYWFIFGWEYSHKMNDSKNSIENHLEEYIKEHHLKVLEKYKDESSVLIKVKI